MKESSLQRAGRSHLAGHSQTPDSPLLLIFGLPRSGTTWLGKLFDSHPATVYLHEPDSPNGSDPLEMMPLFLSQEHADTYGPQLKGFVDDLPKLSSARVRGKRPLFSKRHRSPTDEILFRIMAFCSKGVARIIGDAPLVETAPAARVVWKSIESAGRLPLLLEIFPNARCIYVMRHPCGWMDSVRRGEQSGAFPRGTMSSNVGVFAQLVDTLAGRRLGVKVEEIMTQSAVARLAWWWLLAHEHVLEYGRDNSRMMIMQYEEVCERPAEMLEDMFRFAGLEWHRQADEFLKASTSVDTDGYYSVYRDSVRAAWKWREEISATDRDTVKEIVRIGRSGRLFGIA